MAIKKVDFWWASLTVAEKERIAGKATGKDFLYPLCTAWWNGASEPQKVRIYRHCTNDHGLLIPEEKEGKPMSY